MAESIFSRLSNSPKYEPLPRLCHISGCVDRKLIVIGGQSQDSSEKSRQNLASAIDIFDICSESWEEKQVEGNAPSPGTYSAASTSLGDRIYTFGGFAEGSVFFNTVHRLDTKTWCWSQVSPQNADGSPMPKFGCGMIALGNRFAVFGGHGKPKPPGSTEQLFIKNTRYKDGRGWTNEFHIYYPSEVQPDEGSCKCIAQLTT